MKSMVLFLPYYGKLPAWFNVWLAAAGANRSVDFRLLTDLLPEGAELPPNVALTRLPLAEFKRRVQEKFDFRISMESLGRISQFRPALAHVFPELVEGYDHWGFIECDLLPGDIRGFLSDDLLERHDKCFKLGHFQVFRNTPRMNALFMADCKSALTYRFAFSRDVLFFEELLGMHNIARAEGIRTFAGNVFSDVTAAELPFRRARYAYPDVPDDGPVLFEYRDGHLFEHACPGGTVRTREILYAHFQKREMRVETAARDRFLAVPNRFCDWEPVDAALFSRIEKETAPLAAAYRRAKDRGFAATRRRRYRKLCWWQLKWLRRGIVRNGGIDLDGTSPDR